MIMCGDLDPVSGADPSLHVGVHPGVVAAQREHEGHLTLHQLQTHKVVLLVEATVVQQQTILLLSGKPRVEGKRKGDLGGLRWF